MLYSSRCCPFQVFSDTPAKGIKADSGPVLTRTGDGGGDEDSGGQPITICLSLQYVSYCLYIIVHLVFFPCHLSYSGMRLHTSFQPINLTCILHLILAAFICFFSWGYPSRYRLPQDHNLGDIYSSFGTGYHERFLLITRNTVSNVAQEFGPVDFWQRRTTVADAMLAAVK